MEKKEKTKIISKNLITLILLAIIFIGVIIIKNKSIVDVTSEGLKVSSMYSLNLGYEEIEQIALKEELPERFDKTNGIDFFGGVHIGNYKAKDMEKIKAFIQKEQAPYIYISVKNGNYNYVIFNANDKQKTEEIYKEISSKIKK
jgi:hypothetical protein